MQPMLNIALRAARLASEQVQRAQDKLEVIRSEQSEVSQLIAETTEKSEQTIAHTIQKAYPNHALQGQFTGDFRSQGKLTEASWYISAIDNPLAFSNSSGQIAICMAVVIKGKIEHAVIINPLTGEEFTASRGYGAVLSGRRVRVTENRGLESSNICCNYNDTSGNKEKLERHINMTRTMHQQKGTLQNSDSAALIFAQTAAGRNDGCYAENLQQATVLSAALLIQEAGGLVGDLKGGPDFKKSSSLVGASPKVFKAIIKALNN